MQQKGPIIVVEPNDLILGLLERWLREGGYTVIVETSPMLLRADSETEEPRLVIINVPTPRSAEKIIKAVREVHAAPILVLSGRFRRYLAASGEIAHRLGVKGVLPIPFTREELLSAVAASLADDE